MSEHCLFGVQNESQMEEFIDFEEQINSPKLCLTYHLKVPHCVENSGPTTSVRNRLQWCFKEEERNKDTLIYNLYIYIYIFDILCITPMLYTRLIAG